MAIYKYTGDGITFSDANPDYELDLVVGDEFVVHKVGTKYHVFHSTAPDIPFVLTPKEMRALVKEAEVALNVMPNPNNPPYLMYEPKFEIIPKFYEYYNKLLFNGACPIVKFVRTRRQDILGLAELQWVRGKPIYTMHINEKTMADIKLFTNTVVHEMIHLYLYAKGIRNNDKTIIFDNHGPNFQSEMARINSKGFNISIVASGEHYQGEASETLYAVLIEAPTGNAQQCYFAKTSMLEHFEDICASFMMANPQNSGTKIKIIETTDLRVAQYTQFPKSGKLTDKQLKKWYNKPDGGPFKGRVLNETTTEYNTNALPEYKEATDAYVLPFNQFRQRMARYKSSDDYMRAKWAKFPLRMLNKYAEEELKSIVGRVRRNSIQKTDLHNRLSDLLDSYAGRMSQEAYRENMIKLLEKVDPTNALYSEYVTLKLR